MEDKLALAFAALNRLAQRTKDSDLVSYLSHASHHGEAFLNQVQVHSDRLGDLDGFVKQHKSETHPAHPSRVFTQEDVDRAAQDAVQRAMAERETSGNMFTKDDLDAAVAAAVDKAMKKGGGK